MTNYRYNIINHNLTNILPPKYTIAIVNGRQNNGKNKKIYFYLPLCVLPNINTAIPERGNELSSSAGDMAMAMRYIEVDKSTDLKIGDKLIIYIDSNSSEQGVKIVKSLKDNVYQLIIDYYHLSTKNFPNELLNINYQINNPLYTTDEKNQQDLFTFTIDPQSCKDQDDAISLDIDKKILYIHIVDIVSQLEINQPDDLNALKYGYTLYLPNNENCSGINPVNMLPNHLVEECLTLTTGLIRKVITLELKYNDQYEIIEKNIYKSTIISKIRLSYEDANNHLNDINSLIGHKLQYLIKLTNKLHEYYKFNIGKNIPSVELYDMKIKHCYNDSPSHKLIQILMIITNMFVSEFLEKSHIYLPQRFHKKYINSESDFIQTNSLPLIDNFINIKNTYSSAVYTIKGNEGTNQGHFNLNLKSYLHFTSPIRRYFDIIIHRMLAGYTYDKQQLDIMINYLNQREILIEKMVLWCKDFYIYRFINENCIGKIYQAYITKIKKAGIYFLITDFMIEGFIHVSKISTSNINQIWTLKDNQLVDNLTVPTIFEVGQEIKVKIISINLIKLTLESILFQNDIYRRVPKELIAE